MSSEEGEKMMELDRRQFLKAGTLAVAASIPASASPQEIMPMHILRIALLHLAPIPGDLAYNRRLIEKPSVLPQGWAQLGSSRLNSVSPAMRLPTRSARGGSCHNQIHG